MSTAAHPGIGRVALIGGGFMGEGIVQGLISQGLARPADLRVSEPVAGRRGYLHERHGVTATDRRDDAVTGAAIVILAVKPQEFAAEGAALAPLLQPQQLVVSIMAGVRMQTLREALAHDRLVRAIPNTPLGIGEGFTVWTASPEVGEAERERVSAIFDALGGGAFLPDEKYIDMATAVSSSGAGFVMLYMEAMIDAAVLIGFRRDLAEQMVLQTFAGSAKLAQSSGQHLAQLRNAVTSPAGTTAAGLHVLERSGIRAAIADAVIAAHERSKALGG